MKLVVINKSEKILECVYRYYIKYFKFPPFILILSNKHELIDMLYTQKFVYRQLISNYESGTQIPPDIKSYIKKNIIPVISGFKLNYIGNKSIGLIENSNNLPYGQKVGVIKMIGPGEIVDKKLYAYEDLEYLLSAYQKCETLTFWYYIDWYTNSKYDKFVHKYPSKLIDTKYNRTNELDCMFVDVFRYFQIDCKNNEKISFSGRLFFIVTALKQLKSGGTLYVCYFDMCHKMSIQMMYKLSLLFESYELMSSSFTSTPHSNSRWFVFKNFTGKNNSDLNHILSEYLKIDNSLGEKFILDKNKDLVNCELDIEIGETFLKFIESANLLEINEVNKTIEKCQFITDKISYNKKFIDQIIGSNIEYAINFAKKYDLKINDYYENYYYKLTTTEYKKVIFPKANIDYKKLKLTYETTYSITYPNMAEVVSRIIKKSKPNVKTIADMTANVGGNTLSFCKHFDFVYSIEINEQTAKYLKNNVDVYGFTNCEVLNISALKFNKHADFYFYDPPWSGIFYKMETNLDLFLGSHNVIDILKPNFCMKVPTNYNISGLLKKYGNLSIHQLKNFLLIINNDIH